jgi:hypothetical protein
MKPSWFGMITPRWCDRAVLVIAAVICAVVVWRATLANVDLVAGRHELFMDERVTFDGVRPILHPKSIRNWAGSIVLGDQRYGRMLWYSMAAAAWVPERMFGPTGQIVAGRMLEVSLMVAAALVLAFGAVRGPLLRAALLVVTLSVPYCDYYMTMPKPEPLQVLFLALFSVFFLRNRASLGWYWVFAGLAFGCKISALPAIAMFTMGAIVMLVGERRVPTARDLGLTVAAFLAGWAVSVPLLLPPVGLGIAGIWCAHRLWLRGAGPRVAAGVAVATTVIAMGVGVFPLRIWARATFLNTGHGEDQAAITVMSWLRYIWGEWLVAPGWIGLVIAVVTLAFLVSAVIGVVRRGRSAVLDAVPGVTVMMAGILLDLAIVFGVKRLWGFYLYPGTVLLLGGLFAVIDQQCRAAVRQGNDLSGFTLITATATVLMTLGLAVCFWAPRALANLAVLSRRTQTAEYRADHESYGRILSVLDGLPAAPGGRRARVVCSPSQFVPQSTPAYEVVEFWGAYDWSVVADVIVLSKGNTGAVAGYAPGSAEYGRYLDEQAGYAAHVAPRGTPCRTPPCFEVVESLPNGGQVLVRRD